MERDAMSMRKRTCDQILAGIGALVGLCVVGGVGQLALGTAANLPFLIAPMGAAAVILFAVPDSPLARPWPVVGGNTLSAIIGIACAKIIGDPMLAASFACGLSVSLMMVAGCLHPPGGAVALTAVLGGPAIREIGFGFALWPVGVSAVLLLTTAMLFAALRSAVRARMDRPGRPLAAAP